MLTENNDVPNGQAKGSRVKCDKVIAKVGANPFKLKLASGATVWALYASEVESIQVTHEAKDVMPATFLVESETHTFRTTIEIGYDSHSSHMKGTQFPLISNSCTTGHKLQGCTVDRILCCDWYYGANWAYVVLSRVKTMAGLKMKFGLSYDLDKYRKPTDMTRMLKDFREKWTIPMLNDEEYRQCEAWTNFLDKS